MIAKLALLPAAGSSINAATNADKYLIYKYLPKNALSELLFSRAHSPLLRDVSWPTDFLHIVPNVRSILRAWKTFPERSGISVGRKKGKAS